MPVFHAVLGLMPGYLLASWVHAFCVLNEHWLPSWQHPCWHIGFCPQRGSEELNWNPWRLPQVAAGTFLKQVPCCASTQQPGWQNAVWLQGVGAWVYAGSQLLAVVYWQDSPVTVLSQHVCWGVGCAETFFMMSAKERSATTRRIIIKAAFVLQKLIREPLYRGKNREICI